MPTIEQARNWYRSADPVHDFEHVMRVYHLATRLAQAEGADVEIVQAAALLHDVDGSAPGTEGQARAAHHIRSAEFAGDLLRREGWEEERVEAVMHCIRAHRYRSTEAPETIEAKTLFDADKLDVIGAVGAARSIAYAVLDGSPIYAEPSEKFKSTMEKEDGEAHSSYHEFIFKLSKVKGRLFTPSAVKLAEARHAFLQEFYDQLGAEYRGER